MTENDLKRLMAQQYLLYKKLIEVEDKLKGRHSSHSDILLIKDFKEEVDKIVVATGGTSRRPRLILSFQTGPSRAFFVSLYARSRSNTPQIYRISVTNKNKFRKYGAFREDFN